MGAAVVDRDCVRRLDHPAARPAVVVVALSATRRIVVTGNPDAPVLALVLLPGAAAGLGAGLKVYAVIPLLAQRRWSTITVFLAVVALSLPLWPEFIASLDTVGSSLDAQAVGLSAWTTWAMVPAVGALYLSETRWRRMAGRADPVAVHAESLRDPGHARAEVAPPSGSHHVPGDPARPSRRRRGSRRAGDHPGSGHRDHRRPDLPPAARRAIGTRGGPPGPVHQ